MLKERKNWHDMGDAWVQAGNKTDKKRHLEQKEMVLSERKND